MLWLSNNSLNERPCRVTGSGGHKGLQEAPKYVMLQQSCRNMESCECGVFTNVEAVNRKLDIEINLFDFENLYNYF